MHRRQTRFSLAILALSAVAFAARPAYAQRDAAVAGYDPDRGAFIRTPDGSWELNPYAMVQLQNVDVFRAGSPTTTTFSLRAAKFILHGHIFDPSLTYHFQINAGDGRVVAEDIYLRWDPFPWAGILVGQTEVPFNRQHITLEAYQQFIERSALDQRFNLQRDMGAALYLATPRHAWEATLGVWNGSRQNTPNDDGTYLTTARIAYNPWGPIAFREADVDDTRSPKLSFGLAGAYNPARVVADAAHPGGSTTLREIAQGALDSTLRYRGLSITTEAHVRRQLGVNAIAALDYGTLFQLGMFLLPRRLELVARYDAMSGALAPTDVRSELAAGANYYFRGHRLKLQTDAASLTRRDGVGELRLRFQLEFFL